MAAFCDPRKELAAAATNGACPAMSAGHDHRTKIQSNRRSRLWILNCLGIAELRPSRLGSVPVLRRSPSFDLISASIENLPDPKTSTINAQTKYGNGSAFTNLSGSLKMGVDPTVV